MNRTNIFKQCAVVAMGYRVGMTLKAETVVFAKGTADDLSDQFVSFAYSPCLEAIALIAGEAIAAEYLGCEIVRDSVGVQNCLRLGRTLQRNDPTEIFEQMFTVALKRFQTDESLRWAVIVLSEELAKANALATGQVEAILRPFTEFWSGVESNPVGQLTKNFSELPAVNQLKATL